MNIYKDSKSEWVKVAHDKEEALAYYLDKSKEYNWIQFASTVEDVIEIKSAFKVDKEIYDADSFSEYCTEILDNFCESMVGDVRYTRPPNKEEAEENPDIGFYYTRIGSEMIDTFTSRLHQIGAHYYNENDLEISTNWVTEL